ncbi:hypothetical protein [Nocardiopsis salina]|uniref:hypothetical protein n=1 Tax=Nocardiopsis salina TaxID=245836 RepID=UPI00034524D7|nr:hypothetical protein [Nocardiopsis salina]
MTTPTRTGIALVAAGPFLGAALHPVAGGWVWIPGLLLLVAGAAVLLVGFTGPGRQEETGDTPPLGPLADTGTPQAPALPNTTRLRETRLLSKDPDHTFVLKGTVRWSWTGDPHPLLRAPEAQAQQAVVTVARETLAAHGPHETDPARHALAARLAEGTSAAGGAMEVWSDDLDLCLSEEDRAHLDALARVRKERGQWEAEREVERAKRRYFAEDAFASPGQAVLWELTRNGNDVDRAHGRIDTLTELAEAGKGEDLADVRERLRGREPELASALDGLGETSAGGAQVGEPGHARPEPEPLEVLSAAVELIEEGPHRSTFANRVAGAVEQSPCAHLAPGLRERFQIPAWAGAGTETHEHGGAGSAENGEVGGGVTGGEPETPASEGEAPDASGPEPERGVPFVAHREQGAASPEHAHPASANGHHRPGDDD